MRSSRCVPLRPVPRIVSPGNGVPIDATFYAAWVAGAGPRYEPRSQNVHVSCNAFVAFDVPGVQNVAALR